MTKELAEYWSRLEDAIHPDDVPLFDRECEHGFNLDFPPPAFIGDIVNAPIIILENNGGFDSTTAGEFPDQSAHAEYRQMLSAPRTVDPSARSMSPYYLKRNYTKWLISGEAALVNGVAYRAVNGKAKGVERLTRLLPSALFHQKWLREILAPLAARGERFVVIHQWSRWNEADYVLRRLPTAILSTAPVSENLTDAELSAARRFLAAC